MDVQIAGPSRIPSGYDSGSLTYRDKQHLLTSNQKAERVLGTHAPASFLKLDTDVSGTAMQHNGSEPVILNSPVSKCPPSFLPWSTRFPANAHTPVSVARNATADSMQSPAPSTLTSVAPLNFKRRPHRKSLSIAKIETEMTDYKRDAALALDEPTTHLPQADSHWQRTIDHSITRRQSLPDTVLPTGEGGPKRQPRPLPPVPLSRPVSPASSISSFNSHSSPRPLPTPPTQSPVPTISPISFTPASPKSVPPSSLPAPSPPPLTTNLLVPTSPGSEPPSPLSPLSIITDVPRASRAPYASSPRSPRGAGPAARKRHQVHASPYKLARSPTRYSTTSLSSQVSVPPVPPPAELRRRNRNKMAKLIRVLGESPPSDMVFATERGAGGAKGVEQAITEEPAESGPKASSGPLQRSVSLGVDDTIHVFGKSKKALSDPDAGHGVRSQCPTAARPSTPAPFLRLRSKIGRTDNDKAPRYVVSLFGTAESATPERLTFKLNSTTPKMRPTGSYLRGAYKTDVKPVEVKPPPLPTSFPSIDLPEQSQKWVREAGQNRWEVDDYENVVMSLRKL